MNVLQHGTHAATDWLLIKLRAYTGPVELIAFDDGRLNARRFDRSAPPPRFGQAQGVFRNGIGYRDLHDAIEAVRDELQGVAA